MTSDGAGTRDGTPRCIEYSPDYTLILVPTSACSLSVLRKTVGGRASAAQDENAVQGSQWERVEGDVAMERLRHPARRPLSLLILAFVRAREDRCSDGTSIRRHGLPRHARGGRLS
jgi:hypothetical protein